MLSFPKLHFLTLWNSTPRTCLSCCCRVSDFEDIYRIYRVCELVFFSIGCKFLWMLSFIQQLIFFCISFRLFALFGYFSPSSANNKYCVAFVFVFGYLDICILIFVFGYLYLDICTGCFFHWYPLKSSTYRKVFMLIFVCWYLYVDICC